MLSPMADIHKLICWAVIGLFRPRASIEAEILAPRQQLNVLRRTSPKRPAFTYVHRLISNESAPPLIAAATRVLSCFGFAPLAAAGRSRSTRSTENFIRPAPEWK
jgi:hypothetical protein